MDSSIAFNARYLSTWTPDRQYRIYAQGRTLYFIRIGGQPEIELFMATQLGPLGALLASRSATKEKSKVEERVADADQRHREELLTEHKHNFKLSSAEVNAAILDPPARLPGHGPHFGRWLLRTLEGKKYTFQFDKLDDMHVAVDKLPATIGPALSVNVVWDQHKGAYVKR